MKVKKFAGNWEAAQTDSDSYSCELAGCEDKVRNIEQHVLMAYNFKEILLMRFAPNNQIAGNSDVIAAVAGVNSHLTAPGCLFATPAYVT